MPPQNDDTAYLMGRSTGLEYERLAQQGRLFSVLTKRFLVDAGLTKGMRVLDVGCGVGDVSLLCAELVGPKGAVVGVDRDPAAVGLARERAHAAWVGHVTFQEGDLLTLTFDARFDAVVGRSVLMYLADPVAALRAVLRYLRPDGIVAFQEANFTFTPKAVPPSPLYERMVGWFQQVAGQAGAELQMGFNLYPTYRTAGLPEPQLQMGQVVGSGPDFEGYQYVANVVRSILPLMERFGVATADEVAIDTFADRLREEVVSGGGCMALPPLIGAWTRKSAGHVPS